MDLLYWLFLLSALSYKYWVRAVVTERHTHTLAYYKKNNYDHKSFTIRGL